MKSEVTAAKGKKQSKKREHRKAASKLVRAERKAQRTVTKLQTLLAKAEKKLAKHAARAASRISGAITKPEAAVEPPSVPVAIASSAAGADVGSAGTSDKEERDTPPAPKRSVKHGTSPAHATKRAAPNHTVRTGDQLEAPASGDKGADDE